MNRGSQFFLGKSCLYAQHFQSIRKKMFHICYFSEKRGVLLTFYSPFDKIFINYMQNEEMQYD